MILGCSLGPAAGLDSVRCGSRGRKTGSHTQNGTQGIGPQVFRGLRSGWGSPSSPSFGHSESNPFSTRFRIRAGPGVLPRRVWAGAGSWRSSRCQCREAPLVITAIRRRRTMALSSSEVAGGRVVGDRLGPGVWTIAVQHTKGNRIRTGPAQSSCSADPRSFVRVGTGSLLHAIEPHPSKNRR